MTSEPADLAPGAPLDLDGLAPWVVERGMRGLSIGEQVAGYCRRISEAGLPMKRAQVGMGTLHPRYGAQTFVWRPGANGIEHTQRDRTIESHEIYLRSPVHLMRTTGLRMLRRRLHRAGPEDFPLFSELRAEGLTDYAAHLLAYNPGPPEAIDGDATRSGRAPVAGRGLDGMFFSCATDRPEGFDDGHLEQVARTLPYLSLAVKSRLTYDVASTVIETYLGKDAGHRVLTGQIERGSAEAIRAVIWFSDLRGFTRLTDTLPRDTLVEMLDDYLDAMARPVHDHHGQILKFMGDGLLATFDLTGRDEAAVCRNALAAAADLRGAFPAFNAARAAAGKPVMDFGLALHLGEVLYGNIGASDRLDFTVVGPAVNEAGRIQALCRPLGRAILISRTFRDIAGGGPDGLESLGCHALRGVREPQELYTLGA